MDPFQGKNATQQWAHGQLYCCIPGIDVYILVVLIYYVSSLSILYFYIQYTSHLDQKKFPVFLSNHNLNNPLEHISISTIHILYEIYRAVLIFFVDLVQGKNTVPLGTTRDHLRNAMPMVVHFSGFAFCSNDEEDAHELPLATLRWLFCRGWEVVSQDPEENLWTWKRKEIKYTQNILEMNYIR